MSKAVLISIRPEGVEKILNRVKINEIRKTIPKCELPCKVYIYCTKPKKWYTVSECFMSSDECLYKQKNRIWLGDSFECYEDADYLNGKVVAEFTLNKVDKIGLADAFRKYGLWLLNDETVLEDSQIEQFLRDSCLTYEQLTDYIGCGDVENWTFENGYAWHIDNLNIYDKPKELSEFTLRECEKSECACENCKHLEVINTPYAYETNCVKPRKLTKAPQSWCYVEELEE